MFLIEVLFVAKVLVFGALVWSVWYGAVRLHRHRVARARQRALLAEQRRYAPRAFAATKKEVR